MYDYWKSPEQKQRENRKALIITALVFVGLILFGLIGNALSGSSSTTNKNRRCVTKTERYSGIEHEMYCESDYDWIEERAAQDMYDDRRYYEEREAELRAEQLQDEYEEYCRLNYGDC